jgi:RNAse (barnase) inhibitor barstar
MFDREMIKYVIIFFLLSILVYWIGYHAGSRLEEFETSGEVEIAGILRKLIQMSMFNTPPDRYYERAKEEFGSKAPLVHDIDSLYKILMTLKLPKYEVGFDCSESSAILEWILEGYGFKTYIAKAEWAPPGSKYPGGHTWVVVELDNKDRVAIEATLLAENRYNPPGIIVDPSLKYLKYSYIYRSNSDALDFQKPIIMEQANYYYGEYDELWDSIYEPTRGELQGDAIVFTPISEFDWWNHPYYVNFKKKFGW